MTAPASARGLLEEETIVDADVHVSIDAENLARFLDEPYKSRALNTHCRPATKGKDWSPTMNGKIERRWLRTPEEATSTLRDEFRIDCPILNPMSGFATLPQSDLAAAFATATNDAFLDTFLDETDFLGLCYVAPQDPERAAEEIDRVGGESQIVGVFIESTGPRPPLGDPSYDVVYRAAQDNDLAVAYHAAAAGHFRYDFPIQNQGVETFLEVHTLAHLWSQSLTLTSLLVQGVPVKFPELNFCFLEAGVSWVPYLMWRLNKEYSFRRSEAPLLERSPEEYVRDQCYFASQPLGEPDDPRQMQQMLDLIGVESLMFASDYPHWDFDHPRELGQYLESTFDADERAAVLSRTPAEAFGIDL